MVINNSHLYSSRGFTLVESLIYAAIVAIIGVISIGFILNIIEGKAKNRTLEEVQGNARIAINRIVQEIHAATDIDLISSDFGINLADPLNAGKKLSLTMRDAALDPTEFDVSSNILRIKQGSGVFTPLTDSEIKVTNLTFTNFTSLNGRSKNIGITLTVNYPNPGGQAAFSGSITLNSAAELRDR